MQRLRRCIDLRWTVRERFRCRYSVLGETSCTHSHADLGMPYFVTFAIVCSHIDLGMCRLCVGAVYWHAKDVGEDWRDTQGLMACGLVE